MSILSLSVVGYPESLVSVNDFLNIRMTHNGYPEDLVSGLSISNQ